MASHFEAFESRGVQREEYVQAEALYAPALKGVGTGIETPDTGFELVIREKSITFDGFTREQGEWVGGILHALNVSLCMVDRVQFVPQLPEGLPATAVAEYRGGPRLLIIYGGLLYVAARADAERPQGKGKKGDAGKYVLAQTIAHEIVGHSLDPIMHVEVTEDAAGNKRIALPEEFSRFYSADWPLEMEAEHEEIFELCMQSIRTGRYLDDGSPVGGYHRILCATWLNARAGVRSGRVSSQELFLTQLTMIFETRAILMELRFSGEKRLKAVGKAQREHLKAEDDDQNFIAPIKVAESLIQRVVPETRGSRRKVARHVREYQSAIAALPPNPFASSVV